MQHITLPSGLVGFHNTEATIKQARSGRDVYLLHGEVEHGNDDTVCPQCGSRMHPAFPEFITRVALPLAHNRVPFAYQ